MARLMSRRGQLVPQSCCFPHAVYKDTVFYFIVLHIGLNLQIRKNSMWEQVHLTLHRHTQTRNNTRLFLCRWATSHDCLTVLEIVHMCKFGRTTLLAFSVVSRLLYLSFYNCVPDPDMSINKRGLPLLNQTQAMFMFRPVLRGHLDHWARLAASLRAQVESRCASKHQHLLNGLTQA